MKLLGLDPKMPKVAAIIQARIKSSRFPEKVLQFVGEETILGHVLKRSNAIENVDVVCCALPDSKDDDVVAQEASKYGVEIFRGDGDDVMGRYHEAAKMLNADIILRITSDCPLLDPGIAANVIDLLRETGSSYACNNLPLAWPHGLDCEAFTFELLDRAIATELEPWLREHVTNWMRTDPGVSKVSLPGPGGSLAQLRWTVDYPEDLEFMRALQRRLPGTKELHNYRVILDTLNHYPELTMINAMHSDPDRNPDKLARHDLAKIPDFAPQSLND